MFHAKSKSTFARAVNFALGSLRVNPPRRRFRPKLFALDDRIVPSSTFTVTLDTDGSYPGGTSTGSQQGDLRWCVENTASGDSIVFDSTVFATNPPVALGGHELDIDHCLTITGPAVNQAVGADTMTHSRVFSISSAGAITVTISTLTIENGSISGNGGGVYNNGENVTLTKCTLTDNTALEGGGAYSNGGTLTVNTASSITSNTANYGGGFYANGGTITVNGSSSVAMNTGVDGGGGMWADDVGALNLSTCTFDSNITEDGAGGAIYISEGSATINYAAIKNNSSSADGGGLVIDSTNTVLVENTTLSSNTAGANGGGIYYPMDVVNNTTYNIQNSTIDANVADSRGGGVFVNGQKSGSTELGVYNSTIANNEALGSASCAGGGIGFLSVTNTGALDIESTIVAQNYSAGTTPPGMDIGFDLSAGVLEKFSNVSIADDGGWTVDSGSKSNHNGITGGAMNPGFVTGLLNNYGAFTQTLGVDSTSLVYNQGSNPLGLSYAQAGGSRSQDGAPDIGALEWIRPADPG